MVVWTLPGPWQGGEVDVDRRLTLAGLKGNVGVDVWIVLPAVAIAKALCVPVGQCPPIQLWRALLVGVLAMLSLLLGRIVAVAAQSVVSVAIGSLGSPVGMLGDRVARGTVM